MNFGQKISLALPILALAAFTLPAQTMSDQAETITLGLGIMGLSTFLIAAAGYKGPRKTKMANGEPAMRTLMPMRPAGQPAFHWSPGLALVREMERTQRMFFSPIASQPAAPALYDASASCLYTSEYRNSAFSYENLTRGRG